MQNERLEDKICLLIKFGNLDNLKKLQKGQIYCKNLKWYSDQEKKTGDKAMGDKLEGKFKLAECSIKYSNPKIKEWNFEVDNVSVLLSVGNLDRMPVFCMTGITTRDLDLVEKDKDTSVADVRFSDILSKVYNESYWEAALVIEDSTKFIESLMKVCKDKGIKIINKLVTYTNMDINNTDRLKNINEDINNSVFCKDDSYSYQHEYRFAFTNKVVENSFTIDIGDISDISKLYNREELIEFMNSKHQVIIRRKKS